MFPKNHDIQDIDTLKARFGYMFAKPTISLEFCKGWFPIVVGLCLEIDCVLGEHRPSFHWVQIKEKLGSMRLHFELDGAPEPLRKSLQALVSQAGQESARCCMVCGEPARLSCQGAWMVTVCDVHQSDEVSRRGGRSLRELMEVPEHGEGAA